MKNTRVFIASTTKYLPYAHVVAERLEKMGNGSAISVTVWDEGYFQLGEYTLEALERALLQFDFAVVLCSADVLAENRGDTVEMARSNVIFELGLFMGRLGRLRVFAIGLDSFSFQVLTDIHGLTYDRINTDHEKGLEREAVRRVCLRIAQRIEQVNQDIHYSLPATSLALGYFENFVGQILNELGGACRVQTGKGKCGAEKEKEKEKEKSKTIELDRSFSFLLVTIIPDSLVRENMHDQIQRHTESGRLIKASVISNSRPFGVTLLPDITTKRYFIIDIPSPLRVSRFVIDTLPFPKVEKQKIEAREIANFEKAIKHSVIENLAADAANKYRVERESWLNEKFKVFEKQGNDQGPTNKNTKNS